MRIAAKATLNVEKSAFRGYAFLAMEVAVPGGRSTEFAKRFSRLRAG